MLCSLLYVGCTPRPEANVLGYLIAERSGRLTAIYTGPTGTLTGRVTAAGKPVQGATVLVAERASVVHSGETDARGQYRIRNIPPGRYVPAAVAPGYTETQLQSALGNPQLVQIQANTVTTAPPLYLQPFQPLPLPGDTGENEGENGAGNLAEAVNASLTATAVVTAPFPVGSLATVHAFTFTYAGATVDSLRLYLPANEAEATPTDSLPLLFMVYPTAVDLWQSISVAYAAQGYALLAISPVATRGLDIDAHAADARVALALAQQGALSDRVQEGPVVALGGSFSSAVLHRFLRGNTELDSAQAVVGWVTVGGITDAFAGTHAFYAGKITIPEEYQYLIPALGPPNLYPLEFLRYSPVYTAAELPPTLIIHTAADTIIPIEQAYALEEALDTANIPTEVFYYEDVSHYLQIDEQMTDAGREMFYRVLDFADRILKP